MEDQRLGAAIRSVRLRRRLRQRDVAQAAGVSHGTVSLMERGHCEHLAVATVRRVSAALDIRVDMVGRWRGRGGDLDRLRGARREAGRGAGRGAAPGAGAGAGTARLN